MPDLLSTSFSPEGDKIMFYTMSKVFVLTIGEKKPEVVAKDFLSAKWSPDSQYIVMVSRKDGNIYSVKSNGTELKKLTFHQ